MNMKKILLLVVVLVVVLAGWMLLRNNGDVAISTPTPTVSPTPFVSPVLKIFYHASPKIYLGLWRIEWLEPRGLPPH